MLYDFQNSAIDIFYLSISQEKIKKHDIFSIFDERIMLSS